MKKLVSMIAAGSVAFSLTAVSFAADSTEPSVRACRTLATIAEQVKCQRAMQAERLSQWKTKKIQKIERKIEKKIMRKTTRRSLMDAANIRELKFEQNRRSSAAAIGANRSSVGSSASSVMSSSSSSVMSSSSSSMSSSSVSSASSSAQ